GCAPRRGRYAYSHVVPLHRVLDRWPPAGCLALFSTRMGRFRLVVRPQPGAHFDWYRLALRLAAHSPSLKTLGLTLAGGNFTLGWWIEWLARAVLHLVATEILIGEPIKPGS